MKESKTFETKEQAEQALLDAGYKEFICGSYIKGRGAPAFLKQDSSGRWYIHFNTCRG